MKKYLLVTPWCPYPPYKNGGVHTIYNILKNLPGDVTIDLFYYGENDPKAEVEIKKYVANITNQNIVTRKSLPIRLRAFLKNTPDLLSNFNYEMVADSVLVARYDAVILDQVYSLPFLEKLPAESRVVLMMHDNNALLYERMADRDTGIKKHYDRKQCEFFFVLEKRCLPKADRILYVSALDAELCVRMHSDVADIVDSITLGVDIPAQNQICTTPKRHSLAFSGVMNYGPNEDAALYFAKEVFPEIKKCYSDAEFVIAGKDPTPPVIKLASESVVVTGFVADMVNTITQSQIYVSPLRFGSGTKNKVLEAMAAGMPVFLSDVSREGIEGLKDKENCFFINESNMARVIIEALHNEQCLKTVAACGKKYVEENHSWVDVFKKFELE